MRAQPLKLLNGRETVARCYMPIKCQAWRVRPVAFAANLHCIWAPNLETGCHGLEKSNVVTCGCHTKWWPGHMAQHFSQHLRWVHIPCEIPKVHPKPSTLKVQTLDLGKTLVSYDMIKVAWRYLSLDMVNLRINWVNSTKTSFSMQQFIVHGTAKCCKSINYIKCCTSHWSKHAMLIKSTPEQLLLQLTLHNFQILRWRHKGHDPEEACCHRRIPHWGGQVKTFIEFFPKMGGPCQPTRIIICTPWKTEIFYYIMYWNTILPDLNPFAKVFFNASTSNMSCSDNLFIRVSNNYTYIYLSKMCHGQLWS